jgi:GT2 family glycosyltransferase
MTNFLSPLLQKATELVFGKPAGVMPYGSVEEWLDHYRARNSSRAAGQALRADGKHPKVSVLILTYNNLLLNQLCLESIFANTDYPNFEVVVVDNASTDGTPDWLKKRAATHSNLRLILNSENRGFAAGNNQAAREASGEYLIFLNNDTVVTQGWIERLLDHLRRNPDAGLVGPVTNSTGNEARIVASYTSPIEMEKFAEERRRIMAGRAFDIRMLAFYCVMVRNDQYESLGGLDERYKVGMFEDDDLAVTYRRAGYKALCAEDVFIHHFQGASFGKLQSANYSRIFEENRRKYEEKWSRSWEPYQLRPEVMEALSNDSVAGPAAISPRTTLAFLAGILWSLYVMIRYLGVDDGFLFQMVPDAGALFGLWRYALIFAGFFSFGLILRSCADTDLIRKKLGWLFLIGAAVFLVSFRHQAGVVWDQVVSLSDGFAVLFWTSGFAVFGIGLGFGSRIGNSPLRLNMLTACLLTPFFAVTILADAASSLLGAAWVFLLAYGIGDLFLTRLAVYFKTPVQSVRRMGVISLAVGAGIMTFGVFIMGVLGLTSRTCIILALLIVTLCCFSRLIDIFGRLRQRWQDQPVTVNEIELGALFLFAALFIIYWLGALAPEVGTDALGQRVAVPAAWLREGQIRSLPEMVFSYNFIAGEVLYLLIMPFAGLTAAKVTQFTLGLVLVFSAYFQVFKPHQWRSLALSLFAFWGSTVVWWQMVWGFVDLTQLFYYYCAVLAIHHWLNDMENPTWLVASGILAGLATAVKLNGAGAIAISGMVVVGVSYYRSRSLAGAVRSGLFVLLPAILVLLPWFTRAYIETGNPVFPFANQFFESPLYFPDIQKNPHGVGLKMPEVLGVPWNIFFKPLDFVQLGTYHPLILATVLLGTTGLFKTAKKEWVWVLAGAAAFLAWLITEQNLRYSMYALYLLSIGLSYGILNWERLFSGKIQKTIFQFFMLALMTGGFAIQSLRPSFWMNTYRSGPIFPVDVIFGAQSEFEYLSTHVRTYFCSQWLNRRYGSDAYVWLVTARDHLYFESKVTSLPHAIRPLTDPLFDILSDPTLAQDQLAAYQILRDAGYSHILYSRQSGPESDTAGGIFSAEFRAVYLQLECADRGLLLYKIRPTPLTTGTHPDIGDNLLINSDFEATGAIGLLEPWKLDGHGGVERSNGNGYVRLAESARIAQSVSVEGDQTYQITVDFWALNAQPDLFVQINWYDSSGALIMAQRESVFPVGNGASVFKFYQTAPPNARSVILYIQGTEVAVDNVFFRRIAAESSGP